LRRAYGVLRQGVACVEVSRGGPGAKWVVGSARLLPMPTSRSDRAPWLLRVGLLAAILLWAVGLVCLAPPWVGRCYPMGTFGLASKHGGSVTSQAIWSPPSAGSEAIDATVRWPWEPATGRYHIELALGELCMELLVGVVLLLYMSWAVTGLLVRTPPASFEWMVRSIAVWMTISLVATLVAGVLSMGYAFTAEVVGPILIGGALFGVVHGVYLIYAHRTHS